MHLFSKDNEQQRRDQHGVLKWDYLLIPKAETPKISTRMCFRYGTKILRQLKKERTDT
jgi:hypothetical protein